MLTYQDCLDLCGFTDEEILAIGEHEHIPDMLALELAQYVVRLPDGCLRIRRIILDDIQSERASGHAERADRLELVLRHFIATHPERSNR